MSGTPAAQLVRTTAGLLGLAAVLVLLSQSRVGLDPERTGPAVLCAASWTVAALLTVAGTRGRMGAGSEWRGFAATAALLGLGQALSAAAGVGINTSQAGWQDVPLLLAVPVALVTFRRLVGPQSYRTLGSRVALDALAVLVSAAVLAELLVTDALSRENGAAGSLIAVGYPALGAVLCAVGLVVVAGASTRHRPAAVLVLVAFVAVAVAGVGGAVAAVLDSPVLDVVTGWAWLVTLGAGTAAVAADPGDEGEEAADDVTAGLPLAGVLFGWCAAAAVVLVVLVGEAVGRTPTLAEVVGAAVLVVLAFVRSLLWASDGDRLARELGRAEAYFRSLVQDSSHATVVLDGAGRVTWVSSAVEPQLGWGAGDLVGLVLLDLVHADDRLRTARLTARSAASPDPAVLRLRTRDGSWRDVEVTGALASRESAEPLAPGSRPAGHSGVVLYLRDVTEHRSAQVRLERMAYTDHLTGLPNRPRFETVLATAHAGARQGFAACVLVLDLDGFKAVNDVAGHAAGDDLLVEVADRLRAVVRDRDLVARLGGDEFAVLVHAGLSEATALADRIVAALDTGYRHPGADGTGPSPLFPLSCSIGVAQLSPDVDEATSVRHADLALRTAKAAGKNCVRCHADSVDSPAGRRNRLAQDLPRAFADEQLQLVYQPVVGLEQRRVLGVEALIRWEHPELGPVLPHEFVALAEDDGLIVPLQRWVLRRATADLAGWLAAGRDLQLGVNISVRHVRAGCLAEDVGAALHDSGVPARRLMLELTESMLLGERERGMDDVAVLHERGCIVSLDDFGRGSSSFAHLARFPVDVIKMDRSFVTGVEDDPRRAVLVQGVVELGQRLGIDVVAGGVEGAAQLATLRQLGCRFVQGWLVGRPVPPEELLDLLDAFDPAVLDGFDAGLALVESAPAAVRQWSGEPARPGAAAPGRGG